MAGSLGGSLADSKGIVGFVVSIARRQQAKNLPIGFIGTHTKFVSDFELLQLAKEMTLQRVQA
jgi:hypothetical protein